MAETTTGTGLPTPERLPTPEELARLDEKALKEGLSKALGEVELGWHGHFLGMRRAGAYLTALRRLVSAAGGTWKAWVKAHVPVEYRTVANYCDLYRHYGPDYSGPLPRTQGEALKAIRERRAADKPEEEKGLEKDIRDKQDALKRKREEREAKAKPKAEGPVLYQTPALYVEALLLGVEFSGRILEPCAGKGMLAEALRARGLAVDCSDVRDWGAGFKVEDFLKRTEKVANIVTNPPWAGTLDFVRKALELAEDKAALLVHHAFRWWHPELKANLRLVLHFAQRIPFVLEDGRAYGAPFDPVWLVWEKGYVGGPDTALFDPERGELVNRKPLLEADQTIEEYGEDREIADLQAEIAAFFEEKAKPATVLTVKPGDEVRIGKGRRWETVPVEANRAVVLLRRSVDATATSEE